MKLFDDRPRTSTKLKDYSQDSYDYYNESARPEIERLRTMLEDWFSRYPDGEKKEIVARFKKEESFPSCFQELFIHELLTALGMEMEIHPRVSGSQRRPDYLINADGYKFYSEAVHTSGISDRDRARNNLQEKILEAIDDLEIDRIWIGIKGLSPPEETIPPNHIKRFIRDKHAALDIAKLESEFSRGGLQAMPEWIYEFQGYSIRLFPIPRPSSGDRNIAVQMSAFEEIEDWEAVRKSILKKASRYGNLRMPYILWIDCATIFFEEAIISQALFGKLHFSFEGGTAREVHDGNGALTHNGKPQNTRLSGIVFTSHLYPYSLDRAEIVYVNNPYATNKFNDTLLPFPKILLDQSLRTMKLEGKRIVDILNI